MGHLPDYATLEGKSLELKERLQRDSRSKWEVFSPAISTKKPLPVLDLLYGDGQNIEAIKSSWPPHPCVELGYLLLYVQSSRVLMFNGYFWTGDFELARREVLQALKDVAAEYKIDTNHVVLGGFSVGAMIALDMTLRQEVPVVKCIALSPSSGEYLEQSHVGMASLDKDCITIICGKFESESTHPVVQQLQNHNILCTVEVCPRIVHAYPVDIVKRTRKILIDELLLF